MFPFKNMHAIYPFLHLEKNLMFNINKHNLFIKISIFYVWTIYVYVVLIMYNSWLFGLDCVCVWWGGGWYVGVYACFLLGWVTYCSLLDPKTQAPVFLFALTFWLHWRNVRSYSLWPRTVLTILRRRSFFTKRHIEAWIHDKNRTTVGH